MYQDPAQVMKTGVGLKAFPARDLARITRQMSDLMVDLFPLCRSITGNGVRQTLQRLRDVIPLQVHEVPSGTKVFDWEVPQEWNVNDAYVKNSAGEKVIDFKQSNLHLLSYSTPVDGCYSLSELKGHLYSQPEHPDWIPYRTSYYTPNWGFCLSDRQLRALPDDNYDVRIDTRLEDGHLTYGEYFLAGQSTDEVLISTHLCHPSLASDNLSGLVLAALLAQKLGELPLRYSYRFLFIPGTIGSITWLSRNEQRLDRIKHGLVAACLGDAGGFTYKKSRRGDAEIDRVAVQVLKHAGVPAKAVDFSPFGYDERQYCSPGFDLPVGCLMRTPHGEYPEYHTSADNLELVRPENLQLSFAVFYSVLRGLEANRTYLNLDGKCEPQLGRRGLYQQIGGRQDSGSWQMALLWVLNLSDGRHSLLDIAERSGLAVDVLDAAAERLLQAGLLSQLTADEMSRLPQRSREWRDDADV